MSATIKKPEYNVDYAVKTVKLYREETWNVRISYGILIVGIILLVFGILGLKNVLDIPELPSKLLTGFGAGLIFIGGLAILNNVPDRSKVAEKINSAKLDGYDLKKIDEIDELVSQVEDTDMRPDAVTLRNELRSKLKDERGLSELSDKAKSYFAKKKKGELPGVTLEKYLKQ